MKSTREDNCKSHEDIGLSDVIALSIPISTRITDQTTTSAAAALAAGVAGGGVAGGRVGGGSVSDSMLHLSWILSLLPRTCEITIIAMKSISQPLHASSSSSSSAVVAAAAAAAAIELLVFHCSAANISYCSNDTCLLKLIIYYC
mmetsp:Transcript_27436/g.46021  ORF Transcript_27436/g.46021 Transcript_27436/m.46021 type:complete len:145 (+) Transcript_27436:392-826(+)